MWTEVFRYAKWEWAVGSIRRVGGGVFFVFADFDGNDPNAPSGVFAHEFIEDFEEVLCQALAGALFGVIDVPSLGGGGGELWGDGVVGSEDAGVVEVFVNPLFYEFDFAEIDDEAVFVGRFTGECYGDVPVVSVHERAMSVVQMLAVGEGYVEVCFPASYHFMMSSKNSR